MTESNDNVGLFDVVGRIFALVGVPPHAQQMVAQLLWVFFVTFHIAWVCGYLQVVHLPPPFADNAIVERLREDLRQTEIDLYGQQIISLRYQQCRSSNATERMAYAQEIAFLRRRFILFASREPFIPDCDPLSRVPS